MSTINNGGPAFPMQEPQAIHAYAAAAIDGITDPDERDRAYLKARAEAVGGASLRDYFAAKAMPLAWKIFDEGYSPDAVTPENIAKAAYQIADAMLAARAFGAPAFDPVCLQRVDGIGDGDLCLTVRSQNCLKDAGIYLVGDLVQRSERDLLAMQSLGRKSAHEIKEALAGLGLTLGMKLDGWPKGRRVGQW